MRTKNGHCDDHTLMNLNSINGKHEDEDEEQRCADKVISHLNSVNGKHENEDELQRRNSAVLIMHYLT